MYNYKLTKLFHNVFYGKRF